MTSQSRSENSGRSRSSRDSDSRGSSRGSGFSKGGPRAGQSAGGRGGRNQGGRGQGGRGKGGFGQGGGSGRKVQIRSADSFAKISLEKYVPDTEVETWEDLDLHKDLIASLVKRGIESPYPIQAQSIGVSKSGKDLCGKAKTGSGKTLAFGIPVVVNTEMSAPKLPSSLILVPTRELATQVFKEIQSLGKYKKLAVDVVFGGVNIEKNIRSLRNGVDVLIACPGRLEDLMKRKAVSLDAIKILVLDEADQMADMGFLPAVKRITEACPQDSQKLLFSATLDGEINVLITKYMRKPLLVEVESEEDDAVIDFKFYMTEYDNKFQSAEQVARRCKSIIIFCRTRHGVDKLARYLKQNGITSAAIHGGMRVRERQRALDFFKSGHNRALIATDVAARGIHVDNIDVVLQYDMPESVKDFTHRSGRTGRAGAEGKVVAFVTKDKRKLAMMNIDTLPREQNISIDKFSVDLIEQFIGEEVEIEVKPMPKGRDGDSRGGGRGGRGQGGGGRGSGARNAKGGKGGGYRGGGDKRNSRGRDNDRSNSSGESGPRSGSNNRAK
jgi:superfamily II DNA/RNA helicase